MERRERASVSTYKRKLIEVALPLEAINRESAREKTIRHGHPATLHQWWARRPLAACRAVLFAQLVDDPSGHPELFPTESDQSIERARLFEIIEKIVVWENTTDRQLLESANKEILKWIGNKPISILDPFAGGGSIPLEAQRLGLNAVASDLNPLPVLINKALLQFPSIRADLPPVWPKASEETFNSWTGATGLAEDVKKYGGWLLAESKQELQRDYPLVEVPGGEKFPVAAWLWARTVKCPNPACGIQMPLVRSWWLSKKKERPTFLVPIVKAGEVQYEIGTPKTHRKFEAELGTVNRTGGTCVSCGSSAPTEYLRAEGVAKRIGHQMMVVVAAAKNSRIYVEPTKQQIAAADITIPLDGPDEILSTHPQYMGPPRYGYETFRELYTNRQLNSLNTFFSKLNDLEIKVETDAVTAGMNKSEAKEYSIGVVTLVAFAISRITQTNSSLCLWRPDASKESVNQVFSRQAISMVWDFAEGNPLHSGPSSLESSIEWVSKVISRLPSKPRGSVFHGDARKVPINSQTVVSTDPPYYDNVPYADLADYFYVWLRPALLKYWPEILGTVLTPKQEELVADHVRWGGKDEASQMFEKGFTEVFDRIAKQGNQEIPTTIFYAFKQSEDIGENQVVSTGWETLLTAILEAGLSITATWPIKTELGNRMRSQGSNALASSIVLACRPRSLDAPSMDRRGFTIALKKDLPSALRNLQQGSIAPVDLAQATIGPGMAIFSSVARVNEADGTDMKVSTALAIINQVLAEILSEQEGDFDAETRFCIKWFSQFGWNEGESGQADLLSKAVNTSLNAVERGGIFRASAGKARLKHPSEMSKSWDPLLDKSISVWEVAVRLAFSLQSDGATAANELITQSRKRVDLDSVKELSYLLYSLSEKNNWNDSALLFNGLGTSWSDLEKSASKNVNPSANQEMLDL